MSGPGFDWLNIPLRPGVPGQRSSPDSAARQRVPGSYDTASPVVLPAAVPSVSFGAADADNSLFFGVPTSNITMNVGAKGSNGNSTTAMSSSSTENRSTNNSYNSTNNTSYNNNNYNTANGTNGSYPNNNNNINNAYNSNHTTLNTDDPTILSHSHSTHLLPNPTPHVPLESNVHDYFFRNVSADSFQRSGRVQESLSRLENNSYDSILRVPLENPAVSISVSGSDSVLGSVSALGSLGSVDSDDSSVPLSLTAQELTLQESKTYMRWYSDILARTNSRTITMVDVFNFLVNFRITQAIKEKISKIFLKIVYSINIGEFFALLRLISHTLSGEEPSRRLIKVKAPVPTPPSILSKKRQNDDTDNENDDDINTNNNNNNNSSINSSNNIENDVSSSRNGDTPHENKPLDLDSFTQFLLTGERPGEVPKKKRSKKLKSVKFSDQIVTDIHDDFMASPLPSPLPLLDYSLPMDQLLDRMKQGSAPQQQQQQVDEDEQEVLKEMESQINHFQNLHNVDTALIGGVPLSIHFHDGNSSEHLLRPNMTGPAQMARMFSPSPEPELLKPNMTGPVQMAQLYNRRQDDDLSPAVGVTNPTDMARMFAPSAQDLTLAQIASLEVPRISLQSFTSQMTGNTLANTQQNGQIRDTSSPRPPSNSFSSGRPIPPPPVPTSRRSRSVSSPTPRISSPLTKPPVPQSEGNLGVSGLPPPVPPRSPLVVNSKVNTNGQKVPPPPPPSRRRGPSISSPQPPPLPPKVTAGQTNEDNSNNYNNDYNSYNSNYGNIANPAPTVTFNNYNNGSNNDTSFYNNQEASDSTANILDDLKALQAEVDKIRDMTGGF